MTQYLKQLYKDKEERNKIIETLFVEHGFNAPSLSKATYQDLVDCDYISDFADYTEDSSERVFKLSKEAIHNIIKGKTPKQYILWQPTEYKATKMALDDELTLKLAEPDLDKFMLSCGFKPLPLSKQQAKGLARGFDTNKQGYLYIARIFNEDIEFIKYGVTNSKLDNKRTRDQLYAARRQEIKYDYEELYVSPLTDGALVYKTETEIKDMLRFEDKIPKSLFPDGHTETCNVELFYKLLEIVEHNLGYEDN